MLHPLAALFLLMNTGDAAPQPSLAMKPIDCFPAALCAGNVGSPGRRVESWVESAILRQSRGRLAVTTPSNVLALLKASGMSSEEARQSCQDDECVQQIMGALDINYLLGTEFYTVGSGFEVSLKLWSGERSLATEMVSADRIEGLREQLGPVVKTVLSSIFVPDRPITGVVPETSKADLEAKQRILAAEAERQRRLQEEAAKREALAAAARREGMAKAVRKQQKDEERERQRLAAEVAIRQATEGFPGQGLGSLWIGNFGRPIDLGGGAWLRLNAARYHKEKDGRYTVGLWVDLGSQKKPFAYDLNQFALVDQQPGHSSSRFFPALTQLPKDDPNLLRSKTLQPGQSTQGWIVFFGLKAQAQDLALVLSLGPETERIFGIADGLEPDVKPKGEVDLTAAVERRRARKAKRKARQPARRAKRSALLRSWRAHRSAQKKAAKKRQRQQAKRAKEPKAGKRAKRKAKRKAKRQAKRQKNRQNSKRKAKKQEQKPGPSSHRKAVPPPTQAKPKPDATAPKHKKVPWSLLFPIAPRHDYLGLTLGGFSSLNLEMGDRDDQRWNTDVTGIIAPSIALQIKSPWFGQHIYGRLGGEVVGGLVFRRPFAELAFEAGWAFPVGGAIQGFSKAILSTDVWRFPKSVLRCGVHSRAQISLFRERHIGSFRQAPAGLVEAHRGNEAAIVNGEVGGLGAGGGCTLFSGHWAIQTEGFQVNGQAKIEGNEWMGAGVPRESTGIARGFMLRLYLLGHKGFL